MPLFESTLFDRGEYEGKNGKPLITEDVLYKIQLDTLDDWTFKFSGLVCSLEHAELKRCFSEMGTGSPLTRNNCIDSAKLYGDCIYRRHHYGSAAASNTAKCNSYFKYYNTCLSTNSIFTNLLHSKEEIDNQATQFNSQKFCQDFFYKDYLYCLKHSLRVHNGPFDSKQN